MINVGSMINNVGKVAGSFVKSEAVKKISLSAAVGAVGVLGQKGCEKLLVKSEKMTKKAESKKRDRNIRSWQGKSCEDMI